MAISLMLGLVLSTASAAPPAPAAPPPACSAAVHRQFDFWVGDWQVAHPDTGAVQGRNTISRGAGGCVLHEHWRGASGYEGHSLNAWDSQRGQWTQFWVGADGVILRLAGGLREGGMVLEGELPRADGGVQRQRITWTPAPDGSVTQHWQVSDDDGASWTTSFLGRYVRVAEPAGGVAAIGD